MTSNVKWYFFGQNPILFKAIYVNNTEWNSKLIINRTYEHTYGTYCCSGSDSPKSDTFIACAELVLDGR